MAVTTKTVSILPGQSLSSSVNCSAASPIRIRMPPYPSTFTYITFQISTDDISYMDYFNSDGTEVSSSAPPGASVRVNHTIGNKGSTYIKIRAGSRDRPIVVDNQVDFIVVLEQ